MKQTTNGELITFLQLLKSCTKIVIPKIQRDYAQGRKDSGGSNLCEEVRNNFVEAIKNALTTNSSLVLDYIYGSRDEANFFYPIDGQQRLTTLFLLHWYVAMKEDKLSDIKEELSKFTYEIRDTSKEFCMSLLEITFDTTSTCSARNEILNSANYYSAYNNDPTVQAMLVMLEKIHKTLKDEQNLFDKLENISFWSLSLKHFGLTDDLFVKMNARGKRLSRYDTFKSELESALDKRIKSNTADAILLETVERWKKNIDNEYLDAVWADYGKDFAERNVYRIIMFFTNCMITAETGNANDSWETNDERAPYNEVIEAITSNPNILQSICNILQNYNNWKHSNTDMSEIFVRTAPQKRILHYVKLRIFGILYWWASIDPTVANMYFSDYYRILSNYIASNREYSIRARQYQSSIDAKNIGARLNFVKSLVDGFINKTCDFYSYIKTTTSPELAFERQKLNFTSLNDIVALEGCAALRLSIHNIFFDDCIHIGSSEIDTITKNEKLSELVLRIILSYSNGTAGKFKTLVFDDTTQDSGRRKLCYESETDANFAYYHRYFLSMDNTFGDKVLTAEGKATTYLQDLQQAVRCFAKSFHTNYYGKNETVENTLQEMLSERLQHANFADVQNILWYIVKYREFFYTPSATSFLVLRRKYYDGRSDDDNVYDIRCLKDSNLLNHYNPFYLAVSEMLKQRSSSITIEGTLRIYNNQIEYKYPCMLSNGWRIRILKGGDWKITFNGNTPRASIAAKYNILGDEFILENSGEDCIELISNFIMECN